MEARRPKPGIDVVGLEPPLTASEAESHAYRVRLDAARALFGEYARALREHQGSGDVLVAQGFADELAGLPGDYAPPRGALFLATIDGQTAGCVAIREWRGRTAEMKRLYVRPAGRGARVGERLVRAALEHARFLGYDRVRLDTLPFMTRAVSLYVDLGFAEIAAYRANPMPGARFFEITLPPEPPGRT